MTRRQLVLGLLATGATAHAQQLAHAGWRGNSIAPEAWWKHAIFVRFGEAITFAAVAQQLDNMADAGADSVLLPDLTPTATAPFSDRFGTEDDLDTLLREAAARRMHVLVRMPLQRALQSPGEVRYWMTRGIAGLDIGTMTPEDMDAARSLRTTLDAFRGDRILIARVLAAAAAATTRRKAAQRDPLTLHIVTPESVGSISADQTVAMEIVAQPRPEHRAEAATSSLPGEVPDLASLLPLLLATGAPILDIALLSTKEQREGIHQVLALRTTQPQLRSGSAHALTLPNNAVQAWTITGRSVRQPLLLISNTGSSAVSLHFGSVLAAQGIRGAYVRVLLRSDGGMGSWSLQEATLPAGAAIIGEVRSDGYAPVAAPLDPDAPPTDKAVHRRRKHRRK